MLGEKMADIGTCKSCGKELGSIYGEFRKRLEELYIKRFGIASKNTTSKDWFVNCLAQPQSITEMGCGPILAELGVNKDCCRMRIMTKINFNEIYRGVKEV